MGTEGKGHSKRHKEPKKTRSVGQGWGDEKVREPGAGLTDSRQILQGEP